MSNLVFIEDKIINKDKLLYVDIYSEETDSYKVNDIVNLKRTSDTFYFFRKDNDYLLAKYNEPHRIHPSKSFGTLYLKEFVFTIYIDSELCSNRDLEYKYPDIFDFRKKVGDYFLMKNPSLIGEYIETHFEPIINYGTKIYLDTTPVKEIDLQAKYSSKEEILNYFK